VNFFLEIYFWKHLESSEGLELCFLCVRAEYCGCGLAGRLAEETIRLAVDRSLGFVKSNPTTEATFRVFRKLGFRLIRQMKLADYSDGTEAAFPHAEPDDCVGIAVKYILK
jgi:ribosomal protein S18 acetylase RimI-like enzyme